MEKKQIYIDVDDVVSKTTDAYPGIVEEEFGRTVSFEDLTTFDLKASFRLTDNEFHYFFDRVHQEELLMGFAPVEGAVEGLVAWTAQGHCVDIVTGRPTSARQVTLAWLDRHRVPYENFIMVDKYNRPGNDPAIAVSKAQLARQHYDLAVEDSGDMALFLADEMGVETVLIDKPWNRSCPEHPKITRCRSWKEIVHRAA